MTSHDLLTPLGVLIPGYLQFSDQPDLASGFFKSESFPVNNQIFLGYEDGDDLVMGTALVDSLIVFKHHSVWRIGGIPPTITINPIHFAPGGNVGLGSVSPKLVVQDHDELLFPARDGYHLLSRFVGVNSGFASDRISLPIDRSFLDPDAAERAMGHAVYHRMKRQLRAWVDFDRAFVLQFGGEEEAEATSWSWWDFYDSVDLDNPVTPVLDPMLPPPIKVTASVMAEAVQGILSDYDITGNGNNPDQVNYIGTDDGLVLQTDWGCADLGAFSYPVSYITTEFAPAGRGTGARGRALDIQVGIYTGKRLRPPILTFMFNTDQILGTVNVVFENAGTQAPDSDFDLLRRAPLPTVKLGALLSMPGLYHHFGFTERDVATMYRFFGWDYWFQTLTPQTVTRAGQQAVLLDLLT